MYSPKVIKVKRAGCTNYPELITTGYIHESKYHTVPHKHVQIVYVNQINKNLRKDRNGRRFYFLSFIYKLLLLDAHFSSQTLDTRWKEKLTHLNVHIMVTYRN
jgi:hypothetical protein